MPNRLKIKEKSHQNDLQTLLKVMQKEMDVLIKCIVSKAEIPDDPLNRKKKRLRQDLFRAVGHGDYWTRIPKGFKLIEKDVDSRLSDEELAMQKSEFAQAAEKIAVFSRERGESVEDLSEKLEGTPDSFQKIFGLSDQTVEHFYQSGCRYYRDSHYQEAGDIFYTITFINPYIFNAWLSLGLCEMQQHHYEKALEAFAMASLIDMNAILPHLHSAECYIQAGNLSVAKETVQLAEKIMREHPPEDAKRYEQYLHRLRKAA